MIMKLCKAILLTVMLSFMAACTNETDKNLSVTETITTLKTPEGSVQTYVESNAYINVDVQSIAYGIANPASRSVEVSDDDVAKMKATTPALSKTALKSMSRIMSFRHCRIILTR